MDAKLVSYALDKDPKSILQEISRQELYKILWRSGKELVIDAEFDNKITAENPKIDIVKENILVKENTNKSSTINSSKVIKEMTAPLVQETLPPAPKLARRYRGYYYVYKINGQRVKPKEFIEKIEKYDTESYELIAEGEEIYSYYTKKQNYGTIGILLSMPLLLVSENLGGTIGFGSYIYSLVMKQQGYQGHKMIKKGIKSYEKKRKSNSLHKAIVIPFEVN